MEEKRKLTDAELLGYSQYMKALAEAETLHRLLVGDSVVSVLYTDRIYLAASNLENAKAQRLRFLSACGIERPEEVQVTQDGTITRAGDRMKQEAQRAKEAREEALKRTPRTHEAPEEKQALEEAVASANGASPPEAS